MRLPSGALAAPSASVVKGSSISTESLVFIREHFKLPAHVAAFLFRAAGPDYSTAGGPRFRGLQNESAAAFSREAPGACTLRRLPLHRHGVPPASVDAGRHDVDRRPVAKKLRDGSSLRGARCACQEPAPDDAALTRSGWLGVPPWRQALGVAGRSRVADPRGLGQRSEVTFAGCARA